MERKMETKMVRMIRMTQMEERKMDKITLVIKTKMIRAKTLGIKIKMKVTVITMVKTMELVTTEITMETTTETTTVTEEATLMEAMATVTVEVVAVA